MLLQAMNNGWRSAMRIALCGLLFVAAQRCEAQNLVPNPSFEEVDSCPHWPVLLNYTPGSRPTHWFTCSESPDYFNACVDTVAGVPSNMMAYQPAFDGAAYSGMLAYQSIGEDREMIATELITPLDPGQAYYVSFRANAAFAGELFWPSRATNNMGMLFTMQATEWTFGMPQFGFRDFAQVYSSAVISDTADWTLVSGSFVADSAYRYLVIGNHFHDSLTTIEVLDPDTIQGNYVAYTFVDDVCVSPDPAGCPMVNGLNETPPFSVLISPNPSDASIQVFALGPRTSTVQIIDMAGRVVYENRVVNTGRLKIEVGTWPSGVYMLIAQQGKRSHRSKFVVL